MITTGEPSGIGPDVLLAAACKNWPVKIVGIGNRSMLLERSKKLRMDVSLLNYSTIDDDEPHVTGTLPLIDLPLRQPVIPGVLNTANASFVLAQLDLAIELCKTKEMMAMVTGPVHKGVINNAGIAFSGHTEFLAQACDTTEQLMMLLGGDLKIALATTHLPLRQVSKALKIDDLKNKITTLHEGLQNQFNIADPCIVVLGVNPHAGEGAHLGSEEEKIIAPVCDLLRKESMSIVGPISADTAFVPDFRRRVDAYMAMYHDQGLPVLKANSPFSAVNVTLGLPIIRTSVDHGTALDIAGSGKAHSGSIEAAIKLAIELAESRAK